jgi:hypothetical protein
LHGGSTATHQRAARTELARRECAKLSIPIETNPTTALLGELYRTAGWVATYEAEVQKLPLEDGRHWGMTYGARGLPTGEAKPHVLVELLHRERRHLADVSTAALRANIDERMVRITEQQGEMVANVMRGALIELGVWDQPETPGIVRKHLMLIDPAG